ncbi:DUF262 domain-containing protein [Sphaerisporangium sp. NPDC051017]|uniref:DUF262 domain-containing protein n=1 Tax=Sphaerisporangium sp. NPDC051017 TaxID=3154636 RepID=UPI0034196654
MAAVTRPKVDSVLPSELVEFALQGKIRMPSFQRSYRWERRDVTELFDSILRGYPIGNLLVWQRPADVGTVVIGHLNIEAPALGDAFWVVDGQQRITSLVAALTATEDTVDPRFRIYFDLSSGKFVSLPRRAHSEIDQLPMALLLSTARTNSWIRDRPHLSDDQIALADRVVAAIRDYKIPMYVVTGDDENALRDIFDRMNTFGKPLKSAEVFNALHSISTEQKPSDLRTLATSVRTFGFGELSEQILMQSLLAIRDPKVDRDFREEFEDDQDRHQSFVDTEAALGHVIDFLRDEAHIPHSKLLPYSLFIPVLARFMATFGPPEGRAAELLRRWIWRGAVLGVAPQGNTVGVRQGAGAIHTDPSASAGRLLDLLPPASPWRPDLSQTRLNRAQAKVNVLGLLSRSPRRISVYGDYVGEPIDAAQLLEAGAPLVAILNDSSDLGKGIANRIVHPPHDHADLSLLFGYKFDERVLASHCLDPEAMELLRSGHESQFLERRAAIVRKVIADHVQSQALFGFRDGPDLTALFDEDDDLDQ